MPHTIEVLYTFFLSIWVIVLSLFMIASLVGQIMALIQGGRLYSGNPGLTPLLTIPALMLCARLGPGWSGVLIAICISSIVIDILLPVFCIVIFHMREKRKGRK